MALTKSEEELIELLDKAGYDKDFIIVVVLTCSNYGGTDELIKYIKEHPNTDDSEILQTIVKIDGLKPKKIKIKD